MQNAHYQKRKIKLIPLAGEVGVVFVFVVIVLKQFAHQQYTPGCCVFTVVFNIVIAVTHFMTEPVYHGTLYRTNEKMNG